MIRQGPSRAIAFFAVALCGTGIAGAMGGATIGASPIMVERAEAVETPDARFVIATASTPEKPLPDHYPLVTPDGTIPVEELALHGRFRDEYSGAETNTVSLEADYDDFYDAGELDRLANGPAIVSPSPSAEAPVAAPSLDFSDGPATLAIVAENISS